MPTRGIELEPERHFLFKADVVADEAQLRALRSDSSERAAPSSPSNYELERVLETALGTRASRWLPHSATGTFHSVHPAELPDGRSVVVRASRVQERDLGARHATEAAVARRAFDAGVPCARCLAIDSTRAVVPFQFTVYEWLAGETLASRDEDEELALAGLEQLGGHLRRLHTLHLGGAGPLRLDGETLVGSFERWSAFVEHRWSEHVEQCVSAGSIDAPTAQRIQRTFPLLASLAPAASNSLLHGDPGGHNLVCERDGRVRGLIDWEDALCGDPLFEIASCASFHPERRWPALMRGYAGVEVLAEDSRPRFWLYFLRIAVARMVVRQRFGLPDRPGRAPAVQRIALALEHLEWLCGGAP